jgi:hypothetical protein
LQGVAEVAADGFGGDAQPIDDLGMSIGDVVLFAGIGIEIEEREFDLLDPIAMARGDAFYTGLGDGVGASLPQFEGLPPRPGSAATVI